MDSPAVFISHASSDGEIAVRCAEDLRERGADVWLDATHAGPGNFVARINQALRRDVLVLVLSPAAIHSPWVQQEMDAAIVRSNRHLL
jgi:TIR domain